MSNQMVDQVYNFNHRVLGVISREKALLAGGELDYALKAMAEERQEFEEAHKNQDYVGAVDAVLDQMYFCIGFLCRMGLSIDQVNQCFTVVHEANLEKRPGQVDKRGGEGVVDAIKAQGWVGPEERLAEILGG